MIRSVANLPPAKFVFILFFIILSLQLGLILLFPKLPILINVTISQIGFMLTLTYFLSSYLRFDLKQLFPLIRPSNRAIIFTIVSIVVLGLLIDYLVEVTHFFLPVPDIVREQQERLLRYQSTHELILKLFVFTLIPGICEEFFFRGFCQTSLTHSFGSRIGIFVAALLFAVAHSNIWYIHLYFILGLFLGYLYQITKTLWIPIIAHVINNAGTIITHYMDIKLPFLTSCLLVVSMAK